MKHMLDTIDCTARPAGGAFGIGIGAVPARDGVGAI